MPAAFIILFLSVVLIDNYHEVTVDTALRLPYPSCEAALSYRRAVASHWRVDCKSFRTASPTVALGKRFNLFQWPSGGGGFYVQRQQQQQSPFISKLGNADCTLFSHLPLSQRETLINNILYVTGT